ncbi:hypothetical protein A1O7_05667 [Cladophialophora yegresii CBS 114405]|uniref:Uncharacterized protein n=1 Tax=Cladophialophora yegresii CBS 114405 TaxID=1182544 RepID=W9VR96_9EURO|nr:uncharacterized protein A1O7_05667 [Cladophialophora yegresii CBS 114405]EXJ58242.1 hypothetical protein A1O7_05667 [Cladophialophora yegresii CBS 114405]
MPAKGSLRRFDRSRIAPLKVERDESSEEIHRPQHVKRQGEVPPPPPPQSGSSSYLPPAPPSILRLPSGILGSPPKVDTRDDELDGESDSDLDGISSDEDGIDPGEEADGTIENPFIPATATTTRSPSSITASTTTSSSPGSLEPTSASSSVASSTSTPGGFFTSSSGATTTGLASVPVSTSISGSTTRSDIAAAPVSTSSVATVDVPEASNHPLAKTAVIVPAVIGSVAAIAAVYLLFRYCVPLRARWTIYRARKGQKLPEAEDGIFRPTTPQMTEASYVTKTASKASGEESLASTQITMLPTFPKDTAAAALPITNTRAAPPVLVRNVSTKPNAQNPLVSKPALSRSNSATRAGAGAPPEGYGTYAFNFNLSDYAASQSSNPGPGHHRHPSGLANNPPTPRASKAPAGLSNQNKAAAMPTIPFVGGGGAESELGVSTPTAAHFGPKTPPESEVNYSPRRLRKSITPSESVSNIPDSPYLRSSVLMPPPPMPAAAPVDSRWSSNSSSLNGRLLAQAVNMGPVQDRDVGTAPNARRLSR